MNTLTLVVIVVGGLLGLAVLAYAGLIIKNLRLTKLPIPGAPEDEMKLLAKDLPGCGDGSPTLDIYGPVSPGEPRPLVIFYPGDGPEMLLKNAKDWGLFPSHAAFAVAQGYVAAVVNHRSSHNYKDCGAMLEGLYDALDLLRARAGEWGIDPGRVVVWTFSGSSGPALASLLQDPPEGLKAAVSFYGFLDLSDYALKVPAEALEHHSLVQTLEKLDTLPFPLYLAHAEKDRKMMRIGFEHAREVVTRKGLPVETRVLADAKHGFEVLSPEALVHAEIERVYQHLRPSLAA